LNINSILKILQSWKSWFRQ